LRPNRVIYGELAELARLFTVLYYSFV
jgi:hypothetical protein